MAVSVAVVARDVSSLKRVIATLTFSGTYTTGGEQVSGGFLKALAMSKVHMVNLAQDDVEAAARFGASYDRAADKVMLAETSGTVDTPHKELSSGASLTNVVFRAEFIGEGNN